ncbi:MAG: penicillin acylase family protein, partial [Kiloniellales bacterium]|nr:penicillin acylase family protein [Kiloniellales bacterium]
MGRIFVALVSGLALLLSGCALLAPLPEKTTLDDRLAMIPTQDLPLTGRTVIHWDQYQIPFIEAAHDEDAALALGVVHAHLRLGQMEILRRIAQGRLAEIAGPIAVDVDHGLRVLDFGRATAEIEASLPPSTRAWLESYVAGINHYQQQVAVLPVEFSVLGLEREPWRISDVLTIGRLAGSDVNWLVWFNLLQLKSRDDWPQIWSR